MKKILAFLMAMIMLFALAACNGDGGESADNSNSESDNEEAALTIWNGVEGDELEFTLTVANDELKVVLNSDGSCYVYTDYGNGKTIDGADVNHPEFDAEMGVYPTNYGSYEVKEGKVIATLDSQCYYRFFAWGKDGDALKDEYFKVNMSEEYREGYYGKGVVRSEDKGTLVIVCNFDGETYTAESATAYNENGVKISVSIPNADGSYKNTSYYPNGTVAELRDYDSNDYLVKLEHYDESGVLQYIEKCVREEGRSLTTRTDANGNVIRTEERKDKKYENGGYYSEGTIIENGITIYHNIIVEKCGADGNNISSYSLVEENNGSRYAYNVNYADHKDATNNFTLSRETVDGVLTYYYCAVERVTVMEGVEGRQNVTYSSGEDKYTLNVEYIDGSGSLVGVGYDYPAGEYTHGEWETFEYVIE